MPEFNGTQLCGYFATVHIVENSAITFPQLISCEPINWANYINPTGFNITYIIIKVE